MKPNQLLDILRTKKEPRICKKKNQMPLSLSVLFLIVSPENGCMRKKGGCLMKQKKKSKKRDKTKTK